jgi:hypothetical protein
MNVVPRHCELDGFIEIDRVLEGVALPALAPCDTVKVRTHNSDYEIFVLDPESGRALVQGGRFFPQPMEAIVRGSTFGGCMLKMGWLGVGLHMEISAYGQSVITSPVQALTVERMTDALVLAAPSSVGVALPAHSVS